MYISKKSNTVVYFVKPQKKNLKKSFLFFNHNDILIGKYVIVDIVTFFKMNLVYDLKCEVWFNTLFYYHHFIFMKLKSKNYKKNNIFYIKFKRKLFTYDVLHP